MPKAALCQINTTIGAFAHNVDKALQFIEKAAQEGAELAVFPELTLSSYPPLDLLDRPAFAEKSQLALADFARRAQKIPNAPRTIVLGSIIHNPEPHGRALQNASILIHDGSVVLRQPKQLLPTYDVFDEARYFQPGEKTEFWESPWGRLGLSVCEDAWFDDPHMGRRIYRNDPALALRGSRFVVNVSASPFDIHKRTKRQEMFSGFVRRIGAPVIFVNQVGGNDEILFDGLSAVYSADGNVLFEMPSFTEAIAVVDFDPEASGSVRSARTWELGMGAAVEWRELHRASGAQQTEPEIEALHKALIVGIRDYFRKTGFAKAVLGLSGGIDSAVVACLAAEALGPRNVLGLSMPSQYSSSHSLADAEALARAVGLEYRVLSLKFIFSTLVMELKPAFQGLPPDFTEENIQARLRAVFVMAMANKRRALALTTGNKSEIGVGYCTIYGDMAGALGPLGDVYKTRVYELARFINTRHPGWIPESTLTKAPSAELKPNQTDQDTLPPYELLDRILTMHFEGMADTDELFAAGFDRDIVEKVMGLVRGSEFKRRQAAPVLRVTHKAFGLGRRVPVAKQY